MSENPSDEELMELYQRNGDESAFSALYRRHSGRVYGYLSRRVAARQERDDLHQAVFLRFHQSRQLYDPRYPVLQWLFVIARSTLVDHARKQSRSLPWGDGTAVTEIAAPAAPTVPMTPAGGLESLAGLSGREREALELRVLDELSYREIARKLGASEPSVRQIVSRALRKLRLKGAPG